MALSLGTLLGDRYRIVSILGQGGMGAVYRAQDEHLDLPVAVKENLFLSDEYTRQFQREASILASLRHPNLPRVGDYFAIPNQGQYLIMDYIDGEDLRQRIERLNVLTEQDVVLIGVAICDALNYMHNRPQPVVHRDIKPGNIKITPESEIVVVDFGLAKVMEGAQVTITGARAMTPGYSPPEQYGTARTDPRSDIYSLGATLYAALTGVIPEDGLARATDKEDLTPLRQLQPKIDRRLAGVIEKSLAVEPDDRYQSALDFKAALLEAGGLPEVTEQRPLVSPPPQDSLVVESSNQVKSQRPFSDSRKKRKRLEARKRALTYGIGILLIILVISGFYSIKFIPSSSPPPQPEAIAIQITNTSFPVQPSLSPTLPPVESTATPTLTIIPTATLEGTASPLPTPTYAAPLPFAGGNGQVAFVSKRSGSYQIWIMNSDGTQQMQITNLTGGACQPNWSPDGSRLAIISPCNVKDVLYTDTRIYTINANGGDLKPLPLGQDGDFDPSWSQDGKRLAFTSLRSKGIPHIFVYNFSDQTLAELSDTRFPDIEPAWSPDGKQLAIIRKNLFYHVYVISDKGQTQFQFSSTGNVNDFWPVWSHDGRFLIYGRTQENPYYPWLLIQDYNEHGGGIESQLPPVGDITIGPMAETDLSPDSQWIVFEGWPDGNNHDIYRMNLDGKNRLRLTSDPEQDFSAVWRPAASSKK